MYPLLVIPMVTTQMSEAVPITMPSAVSAKRILLARKLSRASLRISLYCMVRLSAFENLLEGALAGFLGGDVWIHLILLTRCALAALGFSNPGIRERAAPL